MGCQVKVFATGRSLVQRSPTDLAFLCVISKHKQKGGLGPKLGCWNTGKKIINMEGKEEFLCLGGSAPSYY